VLLDGRSSWRGKALLICSGVAMVALLCIVGLDNNKSSRAALSFDASSEANNGGTTGEVAHKGDASDFIDTADLGDYVDAIIGPVRPASRVLRPCPVCVAACARVCAHGRCGTCRRAHTQRTHTLTPLRILRSLGPCLCFKKCEMPLPPWRSLRVEVVL